MKRNKPNPPALINKTSVRVRFSEVDSIQIVWHGAYVCYFEDGREAFGRQYGLTYRFIRDNGYVTPIVELNCQYKTPLTVGEEAIIETRLIQNEAAKIVFEYLIYKADGTTVAATGQTTQVFLDMDHQLQLVNPEFFIDWKKKWGII